MFLDEFEWVSVFQLELCICELETDGISECLWLLYIYVGVRHVSRCNNEVVC